MDVQADDHRERNGTRVKDETQGNLMTRLGVKAYISGHNAIDDGKSRTFQPFIEANWIHTPSPRVSAWMTSAMTFVVRAISVNSRPA